MTDEWEAISWSLIKMDHVPRADGYLLLQSLGYFLVLYHGSLILVPLLVLGCSSCVDSPVVKPCVLYPQKVPNILTKMKRKLHFGNNILLNDVY